jgi:hypothetical protein
MRPLSQSKLREIPRVKTHRVEDPPWAVTRNADGDRIQSMGHR